MNAQREWFEKDYYEMLGVSQTPPTRRSPRRTASSPVSSTPTRIPGDAAAEERFKEVSAAYDVLGDDEKRKEYDEVRRLGPMAVGVRRAAVPAGSRSTSATCRAAISATCSVTCSAVARRTRCARCAAAVSARERGADLDRAAHPRLRRCCVTARPPRCTSPAMRQCSTCSGSGAKPGHEPDGLPLCGGRGVRRRQPGVLRRSRRRAGCARAAASVIADPCADVPRHRRRASTARGQDAYPGRGEGRPDHPAPRPRCTGPQRRPGRRPAGRAERDAPPDASVAPATT